MGVIVFRIFAQSRRDADDPVGKRFFPQGVQILFYAAAAKSAPDLRTVTVRRFRRCPFQRSILLFDDLIGKAGGKGEGRLHKEPDHKAGIGSFSQCRFDGKFRFGKCFFEGVPLSPVDHRCIADEPCRDTLMVTDAVLRHGQRCGSFRIGHDGDASAEAVALKGVFSEIQAVDPDRAAAGIGNDHSGGYCTGRNVYFIGFALIRLALRGDFQRAGGDFFTPGIVEGHFKLRFAGAAGGDTAIQKREAPDCDRRCFPSVTDFGSRRQLQRVKAVGCARRAAGFPGDQLP